MVPLVGSVLSTLLLPTAMLFCGAEPVGTLVLSLGEGGPAFAVSFPEEEFLFVVLVDFLSLVGRFGLSAVVFFGTCGDSVGVSRGELPLVVLLEPLRSGS